MEKWVLILLILSVVPSVYAADHYVRDGATGDGSDWANAWDSLPTNLVRGDTYYIADGSYPAYRFDDAESGTQYITIKKAIGSDHGTNVGWQSSYGDGQAVFTSTSTVFTFNSNYWDIDGIVGEKNGADSNDNYDSHGIKIEVTGSGTGVYGINPSGHDYLLFKHLEITSTFPTCDIPEDSGQIGIRSTGGPTDMLVSYCHIHDWKRDGMIIVGGSRDIIVEHSWFENTHSNPSQHGQAIYAGLNSADDWTIRHTTFKNIHGSGNIFFSGDVNGFDIYGNTFWQTEQSECWNSGTNGLINHNDAVGSADNNRFHHNTMVNLADPSRGVEAGLNLDSGTGNLAYNNLWYGCDGVINSHFVTDHNALDIDLDSDENDELLTSDPFVDMANGDFRLKAPTLDALHLPSPYDVDPDGNTRGADGVWDRGAYEYTGAPPVSCYEQDYYCCPTGSTCSSPRSGTGCSGACCASESYCTAIPFCGDGNSDADEGCTCSDCPASHGEVCCLGVVHTGDCCGSDDCSGSDMCQNHVCQPPAPTCTGQGFQCCDSCSTGTEQLTFDADCSEQVCCRQCENPTNLISSTTMTANSENFEPDHPVEHLWDGCLDGTPGCTAGSSTQDSFWVEFDLGETHTLTQIRLFGDDIDQWVSTNWEMQYKMLPEDDWSTAFSGVDAFFSDWSTEILDIDARIVRISVYSDTGSVQAREIELQGSPLECIPMTLAELISEIDDWKAGEKDLNSVMQAIVEWKNGC